MLLGASAIIDQYHTSEYHHGCQYLLPTERVHPYINADDNSNNGLEVGIHTHQRGADAFLPQRDEEVGDEGRAHDEEAQLPQVDARKLAIVEGEQFATSQGKGEGRGEQEDPFHECDDRVF